VKITPKGNAIYENVPVVIDYFTKWVEVASYAKITSKHVVKFLLNNIICRNGVRREPRSDKGSHFRKEVVSQLKKYKIQHCKLPPYVLT